jgi:hypothetical protein
VLLASGVVYVYVTTDAFDPHRIRNGRRARRYSPTKLLKLCDSVPARAVDPARS